MRRPRDVTDVFMVHFRLSNRCIGTVRVIVVSIQAWHGRDPKIPLLVPCLHFKFNFFLHFLATELQEAGRAGCGFRSCCAVIRAVRAGDDSGPCEDERDPGRHGRSSGRGRYLFIVCNSLISKGTFAEASLRSQSTPTGHGAKAPMCPIVPSGTDPLLAPDLGIHLALASSHSQSRIYIFTSSTSIPAVTKKKKKSKSKSQKNNKTALTYPLIILTDLTYPATSCPSRHEQGAEASARRLLCAALRC